MSRAKILLYFAVLFLLTLQTTADQSDENDQGNNNQLCVGDAKYALQKLHYLTTDFALYGQRFLEEKKERKESESRILKEVGTVNKRNKQYQRKITDNLSKTETALTSMQKNMSVLSKLLSDGVQRTSAMAKQILTMKSEIVKLRKAAGVKTGSVSFSAYMTPSLNTSHLQIIPFQGIQNNIGGAYNPSTGIFTDGLYYFHCSILSVIPGEYKLFVNERSKMNLITDDKKRYEHSSSSVILHLTGGNHVFIKSTHSRSNSTQFYVHHYWSNFSGFLIKAT